MDAAEPGEGLLMFKAQYETRLAYGRLNSNHRYVAIGDVPSSMRNSGAKTTPLTNRKAPGVHNADLRVRIKITVGVNQVACRNGVRVKCQSKPVNVSGEV